jgi:hypothetical protein
VENAKSVTESISRLMSSQARESLEHVRRVIEQAELFPTTSRNNVLSAEEVAQRLNDLVQATCYWHSLGCGRGWNVLDRQFSGFTHSWRGDGSALFRGRIGTRIWDAVRMANRTPLLAEARDTDHVRRALIDHDLIQARCRLLPYRTTQERRPVPAGPGERSRHFDTKADDFERNALFRLPT